MTTTNTTTTLATIIETAGAYTVRPDVSQTTNGTFQIRNETNQEIWIQATWSAINPITGEQWSCTFMGTPQHDQSVLVGVGSETTSVSVSTAPLVAGTSPAWSSPVDLPITNTSGQITINSPQDVRDPHALSNPANAGSASLNVTCSMQLIWIVNNDPNNDYHVYFNDPTLSPAPTPTLVPKAPSSTSSTRTPIGTASESLGYITTASSSTVALAKFAIRHTDDSVVVLDLVDDLGHAYPAIIEASASNKVYVVNLTNLVGHASVSGGVQGWQQNAHAFDVAPDGGVYVVDVSAFSSEHQLHLNWDVTGDPKMVIMRPTRSGGGAT